MADDFSPPDEGRDRDEQPDMEEELDELLRHIRDARDDAEHVFAVGAIIAFTPQTDVADDTGKPAEGMVWRVLNPTAHQQYDQVTDIMRELDIFDQKVDEMKIQTDAEAIGLAELFDR